MRGDRAERIPVEEKVPDQIERPNKQLRVVISPHKVRGIEDALAKAWCAKDDLERGCQVASIDADTAHVRFLRSPIAVAIVAMELRRSVGIHRVHWLVEALKVHVAAYTADEDWRILVFAVMDRMTVDTWLAVPPSERVAVALVVLGLRASSEGLRALKRLVPCRRLQQRCGAMARKAICGREGRGRPLAPGHNGEGGGEKRRYGWQPAHRCGPTIGDDARADGEKPG
mmetsp:Transcript_114747/g.331596  ORF Transcript_114747/g.331596 Transcript_114747/m.331596 type:complete len:228 (+) Transcript_114747:1643-2326(+)